MSKFSNFYGPKLYMGPTGGTGDTGGAGVAGVAGGTGNSGGTGGTGGTGLPGVNGMPWNLISTNTNATAGSGYLINATSGNVTLTLPGAPTAGQSVGICDAYNKATTSIITIARNGANIQGLAEDMRLDLNGISFVISYVDTTIGWKVVSEADNVTSAISAPLSFKNRVINGGMMIDQRNSYGAITPTVSTFLVDRWLAQITQASKLTFQSVADAPPGFRNSLKCTVASQYSPTTNDYFLPEQRIEYANIVDLQWGTATAQPITVSFWVKGSIPGTYSSYIYFGSTSPTIYVTPFSITASWTKISFTVPGNTAAHTIAYNASSISFGINLGSGSARVTSSPNTWLSVPPTTTASCIQFVNQSVGSTLNITGIQIEKGSVATDFEYRPYSVELAMCQRYYEMIGPGGVGGSSTNATAQSIGFKFQTMKRAVPTFILLQNFSLLLVGQTVHTANTITSATSTITGCKLDVNVTPTPGTTASTLVYESAFDAIAVSAEI